MRDLPRQLSVDELAELFSGRTAFVERLAELDDPLGRATEIARALTSKEKLEALETHPRIGERSSEQHGGDPEMLAELAELNRAYEQRFGFRFIVFVNRRSRSELVPILRERLARTREQELETALSELVEIARARWSSQ
jgi:2-oxo-4-hydroxy-4-carboxy--5-ureidoimidazoline (OHCU) decarboxylase